MGESIAEGTLSRWLKKLGDEVKRDEPMFEISTDKVDAEIPAPEAGTIVEIIVQQGQTVPVGAVVARLETEKGAAVVVAEGGKSGSGAAAAPPPRPADASVAVAASAVASTSAPRASDGNGSSFEDRIRTKSSPLVRRMAADAGVELAQLSGSGIAGRVTKKDLVTYLESGPPPAQVAATSPAPRGSLPAEGPMARPWAGDVVEPMSRMRQLTSEHMVLARRTAMHVTTVFEVDLTRLASIRAKHRAAFEARTGEKLTYLPFIVQSVIAGLKKVPVMNSSVAGTDIIYRKSYNIGIAVALDWGLIVPVMKNADHLSLTGLTKSLNDLSARARGKKLKPEETQDMTFSISNHGVFGSLFATPIIPLPTTGILGIGAIEKRAKVKEGEDGEDTIAIRTCAYFSLSFDHRHVDGSDADKFVATIKNDLESISDPVL
jgi:2-oxoglutarate dehydrogenase E2 component (dihydrolipoamide succinyltransferase)